MKTSHRFLALALFAVTMPDAPSVVHAQAFAGPAQSAEAAIVDSSTQVIREIMSTPGKGIPYKLFAEAQGLVIVPDMIKGGFVIGAKHGRGVALVRDPTGAWRLPQFVTINGGSVGWQVGIQATDLVLVFRTQKSVQGLLSGKFTIGADAAAAAGPIGRDVQAATDARLKAEILSYSRSRGLFAGVSLDGSALRMDNAETAVYYQAPGGAAVVPGQPVPAPASAVRLIEEIARYSKPEAGAPLTTTATVDGAPLVPVATPVVGVAGVVAPGGAADPRVVQQNLAASSQRLGALVDAQWKAFLALPPETYGIDRAPSVEGLTQALGRYQAVATNPQYAALTQRPEFAETVRLLQEMIAVVPRPSLTLPPPPAQ